MTNTYDWLPNDRVYDGDSYLWVRERAESDRLEVGIGVPTIESLGDLAYLTLSEPGQAIRRGESIGSMEAAKMTGEIVSPVSGTIVERNEKMLQQPHSISADPYGTGWLLVVAPDAWASEQQQLHDAESLFRLLPDDLRGN